MRRATKQRKNVAARVDHDLSAFAPTVQEFLKWCGQMSLRLAYIAAAYTAQEEGDSEGLEAALRGYARTGGPPLDLSQPRPSYARHTVRMVPVQGG